MVKIKNLIGTALKYLAVILVAAYILGPFLWLIISSISNISDLLKVPLDWLPDTIDLSRYQSIFTSMEADGPAYSFRFAMINSLIVAISVTALGMFVGVPAAYAFARLKFRGKNGLLLGVLFSYMIPPVTIVIPLYMVMGKLQLMDSLFGLTIIYATFVTPFVIWIMRSYFATIPKDLEDAARIDGCNRLTALVKVILPLAKPGLVATAIFSFLAAWDEFFYANIFTSTLKAKTISVAIAEFSAKNAVDYGMIAAGGVIAALPPMVIALVLQRYIIEGLTSGSVKG